MSFQILATLIFFALIFPIAGILIALGASIELACTIAVIGSLIGACVLAAKAVEKSKTKAQQIYTYNEKTKSLKIISPNHSKLRWILQVEPAHTAQYKYNPATLEYTGVTIGGVSTGSFHINEASVSGAAFQNTGKCHLVLKDMGQYEILNEIVLPDSLVSNAKSTPVVKDFLQGNRLVLKHTGSDTELTASERETIAAGRRQGRQDVVINATLRAIAASYLTKAECDAIKNWLCG